MGSCDKVINTYLFLKCELSDCNCSYLCCCFCVFFLSLIVYVCVCVCVCVCVHTCAMSQKKKHVQQGFTVFCLNLPGWFLSCVDRKFPNLTVCAFWSGYKHRVKVQHLIHHIQLWMCSCFGILCDSRFNLLWLLQVQKTCLFVLDTEGNWVCGCCTMRAVRL